MDLSIDKSRLGEAFEEPDYEEMVDEVKAKPKGTTLLTGLLSAKKASEGRTSSAGSLIRAAQKYASQFNNTTEGTAKGGAETNAAEQKPQGTSTLSDPSKRSPFTNRVIDNLNRDKAAASKAIPLLNGLRDWESREINKDIPLNTTPEGYKAFSESRTDFRKEEDKYSEKAKELVGSVVPDIEKSAAHYGVPEEVIAGAMLDEATRYWTKDRLMDNVARWPTSVRSLELDDVEEFAKSGKPSTYDNKAKYRASWDVGSYNINIVTGYEIFKEDVLAEGASGPLKDMVEKNANDNTPEEKWEAFKKYALFDDAGAAYVVGAVIRKGYKELASYMQNATPEEQAALAVTYYKQGFGTMLRNYSQRVAGEGKITDMNAGEGMRIVHNFSVIQDMLMNSKSERSRTQYNNMANDLDYNLDDLPLLPYFK